MNWERIEKLVERSKEPLPGAFLEDLQAEVHGNHRHRHCRFLYRLALWLKPPLCIELGVEWGVTSAHLCAAAYEYGGHVIGVDIRSHPRPALGLPEMFGNYTFLHMDSVEAAPTVKELVEKHGPLGLVYQDSTHHYGSSWREWLTYAPLLADVAVWACNLMPKPDDRHGMADYWRDLPVAQKRIYRDSLYKGADVGVALVRNGA